MPKNVIDQSSSESTGIASNLLPATKSDRSELIGLQRKNLLLMDLAEISEEVINCRDPYELLNRICGKLREISGASRGCIALEHESGEFLEFNILSSRDKYVAPILSRIKPGQGVCGTAWKENRVIYEQDYENSIYRVEGLSQLCEVCCVPITEAGIARGVLVLTFDTPQENFEILLEIYERYSGILATLLRNAEMHEQRRKQLDNFESMVRINQEIFESTDHRQIMDSICSMAIHGFHANRARIYRFIDGIQYGITGMMLAESNTHFEELPRKEILDESANMWCVRNLKPAHVRVGCDDPRESAMVHAHRKATNIGCSYIVPLVCNGEAWGVFSLHRNIGQPDFQEEEKRLLDLLASQLSLTIYRQGLMDRIEYQANFDQLTGLANRTSFESTLKKRIEIASETAQRFDLLFIDLDSFKAINDTLGHDIGDHVLQKVSEKLIDLSVDDVFVGRLGGDEFSIITPTGYASVDSVKLAETIIDEFRQPLLVNDLPLATPVSIGIASYPDHGLSVEDLLINADIAMYQSKGSGTGMVKQFDLQFALQHKRRLLLRRNLEQAIENEELSLVCQPKVSARQGTVVGGEMLVRWNNADFNFVSPAEWIPIAEESGLMPEIGHWIMERACQAVCEFKESGLDLVFSINISVTQFLEDDFADRALRTIKKSGASIHNIEFEITETAMAEDLSSVIEKLKILREAGLSIAIDDFGIEYSSLSYLTDLPVSVLKIDKKFVDEITDDRKKTLVEAIALMAKSQGLKCVAEGVETEEQLQLVRLFGCDYVQGYYYSKPVAFAEFQAVVERIDSQASVSNLTMAS